jgi:nicotinamidase-related amidase
MNDTVLWPTRRDAALVVIDFQKSLFDAMKDEIAENTIRNTIILIDSAKAMELPIIVTEQYPAGLGTTLPRVVEHLGEHYRPLEKLSFSIMGENTIKKELLALGVTNFILAGMETHVCVLQSALDLIRAGFSPFVISDAVCSRKKLDWCVGIESARDAGATISSTETILFFLLERAKTPEFSTISRLLK